MSLPFTLHRTHEEVDRFQPRGGPNVEVSIHPKYTALLSATPVARSCYSCGMARARISTTVDEELLKTVRRLRAGVPDSVLLEEALEALVARNRAAEIDAAYAAYDKEPLDSNDEWGDLASFRAAAGS